MLCEVGRMEVFPWPLLGLNKRQRRKVFKIVCLQGEAKKSANNEVTVKILQNIDEH